VIDLRAQMLAGFAGGPPDIETSLEMARRAVADGIMVVACAPINHPGLATPSPADIRSAVTQFEARLIEAHIPLHVVPASVCHIRPGFADMLKEGELLPVNGSRYVLVDLPQMVMPANFERLIDDVLAEGFIPILCAPEKLKWVEARFDLLQEMAHDGAWFQITSGSLTGKAGKRPQYWAERLLGSSMAHILASDAHDAADNPPALSEAFELARKIVGEQAALDLVLTRPLNVLDNEPPAVSPSLDVVVEENWGPVIELRSLLKRAG
jgi:protein-tyrosine phosphatase